MKYAIIILNKINTKRIIWFLFLVSIITLAPLFGHQLITGSIVNATLFIITATFGLRFGILAGIIPSIIAITVGILPMILMPIIPYIMLSNAIMVSIFNLLREKNYWIAIISSSFLKFLFLFTISKIIINFIIKEEVAKSISIMMSYPQFITALIGGFLAYIFISRLSNSK